MPRKTPPRDSKGRFVKRRRSSKSGKRRCPSGYRRYCSKTRCKRMSPAAIKKARAARK